MHLFHSWKVRDCQWMRACNKDGAVVDITEILYSCECGKVRTECIDGHWDLNSMLPPSREVVEDFIAKVSCPPH